MKNFNLNQRFFSKHRERRKAFQGRGCFLRLWSSRALSNPRNTYMPPRGKGTSRQWCGNRTMKKPEVLPGDLGGFLGENFLRKEDWTWHYGKKDALQNKNKVTLWCDSAMSLLGIHPEERKAGSWRDVGTPVFILHHAQQSRHGNSPSVHQQTVGLRRCGV